jgi:hypothetical protein
LHLTGAQSVGTFETEAREPTVTQTAEYEQLHTTVSTHGQHWPARTFGQRLECPRESRDTRNGTPHCLEMFARAEIVREEIRARTCVVRSAPIDQIDVVGRAARPCDSIGAVDTPVDRHDLERLGICAVHAHGAFETQHLLGIVVVIAERLFVPRWRQPNRLHRSLRLSSASPNRKRPLADAAKSKPFWVSTIALRGVCEPARACQRDLARAPHELRLREQPAPLVGGVRSRAAPGAYRGKL